MIKSVPPRITLKELAVEAKLSVAAVSMAMRNHPRIAKTTCERVQALAKERGYRPDPTLSALVAYRQNQQVRPTGCKIAIVHFAPAGLVVPDREKRDEFSGITECAEKLGYGYDLFSASPDEAEQARVLRIIRNRGIRGIIFQFMDAEPAQLKANWGFVAAIGIGIIARHSTLPLPTVSADHMQCAYDCMRQLGKLGYRRPSLVMPASFPMPLRTEILGGYLAGLRECPGKPKAADITVNFLDEAWKPQLSAHLLQKKPDVLISAGRATTLPHWLALAHPDLVETLSLCTLDGGAGDTRTSGMVQDRRGVGIVAMETLYKMILANITGPFERPQSIHIPGFWQEGKTLLLARKQCR
ncbi:hypothetical protein DB346_15255 [Verrucomicrobia bacterium LW23]|nr:hypothetical protein DB346_15255 [Verrucomicrobia bacterium LW23]